LQQDVVKQQEFTCPYSKLPLTRPCEVSSCSYNLDDTTASRSSLRCFLHYCDGVRKRPGASKGEHDFGSYAPERKIKLAASFFGKSVEEVEKLNVSFYTSLFSVFAEDAAVELRKHQLDPVPFAQCAVCGSECDKLFIPKGVLPSGYGYCSYGCFQMKPPPVLLIEKNTDLDFGEFVAAVEHESVNGRARFVRQLLEWVLGSMPLRL